LRERGLVGMGLAKKKDEMGFCGFQLRMKMGWENKVNLALALEMKEIICGFNERAGSIAWIQEYIETG
jgi:hypothetical protein